MDQWVCQGWPRPWGIQCIGVFNMRYTVFLWLKLGIIYLLTNNFGYKVYRGFLNFGISHEFSGMLEGLFRVFWYSTIPMADPDHSETLI